MAVAELTGTREDGGCGGRGRGNPSARGGAVVGGGGEDEQERWWAVGGERRTVPKKSGVGLWAKHVNDR